MRLSSARETRRPLGSSTGSASITATSPTRTRQRASAPSRAPMSMCMSRSSTTFLLSSSRCRWTALRPMTPVTGPARVSTTRRWPTSTCASQPPTARNHRKPSSSTWVTISPISSMWPITRRRRAGDLPRPLAATSASGVPTTSMLACANSPAAASQAWAGARSYPEGPRAASSSRSSGGTPAGARARAPEPAPRRREAPLLAGAGVIARAAREALGDHGPDAQQPRPLGSPVARGARAVLLARQHDQVDVVLHVAHGGVVDRHLLARAVGEVTRVAPLGEGLAPAAEQVAQADVGERAAHHHLVISAARAIGVEVPWANAQRLQVAAGGAAALARPGG